MFIQLVQNEGNLPIIINTNGIVSILVKMRTDESTGSTYFKRADVRMWSGETIALDEANYDILRQAIMPQNEQS